jgi:uncharacterized damage-inducible protein DinB
MYRLLTIQYENIKGARSALLDYCGTLNAEDLFKKSTTFNNNSISDLLVHNANTYISWLNNFGLDGSMAFYENGDVRSLDEIRGIYGKVDLIVEEFLKKYSDDYLSPQTKHIARKGITLTLSPLQLFTHVTTHEFHHKGQILTMSRLLGYTPADTDVIR